jgi:photosystem II stability/assembly factor-like uncharacterized protein
MIKQLLKTVLVCLFFSTSVSAQWSQFGSPKGRSLEKITFVSASVGYAITSDDEIHKTIDGGQTWSVVYKQGKINGLDTYILNALYFKTADVGYAVGMDFLAANYLILKTTNGGITWQPTNNNILYKIGQFRAIDMVTSQVGYVVGDLGVVFKTSDGATWQGLILNTRANLRDVDFVDASTGFVIDDEANLLKTTNGGNTWASISLPKNFYKIQFFTAQSGYAAAELGIYKTTNGGQNWQHSGDTLMGPVTDFQFLDTLNGYALVDSRIWKTSDGGKNWLLQERKTTYASTLETTLQDMFFLDNNNGFIAGSFGGATTSPLLLKTTNGGGLSVGFTLSQNTVNCPFPSAIQAKPLFLGATTQIEWFLDSTLLVNNAGLQNIPIPNKNTQPIHKVRLRARNGQNIVELERPLSIEVPPPANAYASVNLSVNQTPCKGQPARIYTDYRAETVKSQLLIGNKIVAGPKYTFANGEDQNFFEVPPVNTPTTYRIQILDACGIFDGGSITVTPRTLPDSTLAVAPSTNQLLCFKDNKVDINVSKSQATVLYGLYQDGVLVSGLLEGNGGTLTFSSSNFTNTANFSIFASFPDQCTVFLKDTVQMRVDQVKASFAIIGNNLPIGTPVSVKYNGLGGSKFDWKFGAKASIPSSTVIQPANIIYTGADSAEIKLTVTSPLGCKDSMSKKIGFYKTAGLSQLWAQEANISHQNYISGQGVYLDPSNNVILTGLGQKNTVLPTKAGIKGLLEANGSTILKYDPYGILLWNTVIEGESQELKATDIDKNGNIVTALDFRPSTATEKTIFYSTEGNNKTIQNTVSTALAKYNTNGQLLWVAQVKSCVSFVKDVKTDTSGNIYLLGQGSDLWRCGNKLTFVSADGSQQEITNIYESFVAKISPSGAFLWVKPLSTNQNDIWIYGRTLELGANGSMYIGGDGGSTSLLKLSSQGILEWRVRPTLSGTAILSAHDIVLDSLGNLYVAGHFRDAITFPNLQTLVSTASASSKYDMFLLKVNPSGKPLWVKAGYTNAGYYDNTALQSYNGSIYLSSSFEGGIKYDSTNIQSASKTAAFILKVRAIDGRYQAHFLSDKKDNRTTSTRYISQGQTLKINAQGIFHWIGSNGYEINFGTTILNRPDWLFFAKFNPFPAPSSTAFIEPKTLISTQIAPNPSPKSAILNIMVEKTMIANIYLSDISGKKQLLYSNKNLEIGNNQLPISTTVSGAYFITIETTNGERKGLSWFVF